MAVQAAVLAQSKPTLISNLEFRLDPKYSDPNGSDLKTTYFSELGSVAEKVRGTMEQVRQDVLRLLQRPWGKREVTWNQAEWDMLERQSKRYDTQALMISCGTVTIDKANNRERRIMLIYNKRIGAWQLPKGRKNIHEDFSTAALRETKEETGVAVRPLYLSFGTRFTIPMDSGGHGDGEFAHKLRKRASKPAGAEARLDNGIVDVLNRDVFYTSTYPDPSTGAMRHIYWYAAKPEQTTSSRRELMGKEDLVKMNMRWFPAAEAVGRLKMSVEKEAVALAVHYAEQMSDEEWWHSEQL